MMCQEAFEAFSHCFRTTCFASLKKLEIRPVESNKSSRLTDKQWVAICDQLRSGSVRSWSASTSRVTALGVLAWRRW